MLYWTWCQGDVRGVEILSVDDMREGVHGLLYVVQFMKACLYANVACVGRHCSLQL